MTKFIPLAATETIAERAYFEDGLPLSEAIIPAARRIQMIRDLLYQHGADDVRLVEGLGDGERPAYAVTFIWRGTRVQIVATVLPFRNRATAAKERDRRQQALGWLYEYLRLSLEFRNFVPGDELFAGHMLAPGGEETVAALVSRLLTEGRALALETGEND